MPPVLPFHFNPSLKNHNAVRVFSLSTGLGIDTIRRNIFSFCLNLRVHNILYLQITPRVPVTMAVACTPHWIHWIAFFGFMPCYRSPSELGYLAITFLPMFCASLLHSIDGIVLLLIREWDGNKRTCNDNNKKLTVMLLFIQIRQNMYSTKKLIN